MAFGDLKTEKGVKELNAFLGDHSYIDGYVPTQADVAVYEALGKAPSSSNSHAVRWYNHIKSFDFKILPGEKKVAVKQEVKQEADYDVDLFASDEEDEEAAKIREARVKAYTEKKSKKAVIIAKSSIVLDVKPWSDETKLDEMEKQVRTIEMDGLIWGAAKLMPVGFGINKLQIMCVVEDDKVSVDELVEKIQDFEDCVQSVDIAAFNKI